MAAQYHSLFTEKGLELLRESIQNGTKLGITHMSFGDGAGSVPTPNAAFIAMVNEVYRIPLNRLAPSKDNPNWLEADGVIPSSVGGFNIREVGLWAGNVMVAYANYPPTYKPSGDQGTAQIKTIRIVLQIDNTANFELKIDASIVMATLQAVDEAKHSAIQYADDTKVHVLDFLAELSDIPAWDGRVVYVKAVKVGQKFGGGYFKFSKFNELEPDDFIVIATPDGRWVKQQTIFTVDDFGAFGDDSTDDSIAFNTYAESPYTGINILLGKRKAVYVISKQVDCKGKGIIGHGFSKQSGAFYDHTSIKVKDADFSNANPIYHNRAFINVGAEIRDLQLKCDVKTIDGLQVGGYNTTISNINFTNFYNQIYVDGATVSFRVSDLMSIGCGNAGVFVADNANNQSTTAYFDRCSWQWGENAILFSKEVYGSSFKNIIAEYMNGCLKAKVFSSCIFDNIWCEQTKDGVAKDWLINTMKQQSFNNTYNNLYIRTPWLDRTNPTDIANGDNSGGVSISKSAMAINGPTGAKALYKINGIGTRHADWFGSSNNPVSLRKLSISSQPKAIGSNYITPVVIEAPNGALWYKNDSDTDFTPVTKRTLIGASSDGLSAFYGVDIYTKTQKKWTTSDHNSGSIGQFLAPLMLTYDATWANQQNNAGWVISKESTGIYLLQRSASNVSPMSNPNIIVGGMTLGNKKGSGGAVNYSLQYIDTYEGSWNSYSECSGVKIFFRDQAGALVDVFRFTVMFTLTSGFS
ncbi:phage tail protein [Acinetobacter baumannii]